MRRNLQDPACLLGAQNLCWVVMPDHVHLPPSEAALGIFYPCVAYPVSDVELALA